MIGQVDQKKKKKKERIIKDMESLNNQPNLTDIYRKFQPKIIEHIFFSITYETPTTIGYILGKNPHDLVIQGIFSDHSGIKLEINKIPGKFPNIYEQTSMEK